ncbi:hypothetical protein [Aureimonas sp. AU40]|uniref:hypothetical protein n=1 Tax=Aureimonas sp. AU40 TaxID=1637747 RepID=UPI000B202F31|nr:hypothetical protein [Aureimonas sp. AU40]
MTDHETQPTHTTPIQSAAPASDPRPGAPRKGGRNAILGFGALGILALGFAGGAAAWSATRPHDVSFDASMKSTPIAELKEASSIGITGQVEQIYGNKFVVNDGASRVLVETGRAGEGGKLVNAGETVTVQGRFDDGFLHAAAIRHADERVDELTPPPPPHHGPRHGPGAERPGAEGPGVDGPGEPG